MHAAWRRSLCFLFHFFAEHLRRFLNNASSKSLRLWLSKRNSCLNDTKSRIVRGHQRLGRISTRNQQYSSTRCWYQSAGNISDAHRKKLFIHFFIKLSCGVVIFYSCDVVLKDLCHHARARSRPHPRLHFCHAFLSPIRVSLALTTRDRKVGKFQQITINMTLRNR